MAVMPFDVCRCCQYWYYIFLGCSKGVTRINNYFLPFF